MLIHNVTSESFESFDDAYDNDVTTGYDHAGDDVRSRGESVEVNAWYSNSPIKKNLDSRSTLDEEISAMGCSCRRYRKKKKSWD